MIDTVGEIDPVTEDMLIGQTATLEQFQWFVRAHLEARDGSIPQSTTEEEGAAAGRQRAAAIANGR